MKTYFRDLFIKCGKILLILNLFIITQKITDGKLHFTSADNNNFLLNFTMNGKHLEY